VTYLSVSDVARRLGVKPRAVSDLFYQRVVDEDGCPVVGNRRLIPESAVAKIANALNRRKQEAAVAAE